MNTIPAGSAAITSSRSEATSKRGVGANSGSPGIAAVDGVVEVKSGRLLILAALLAAAVRLPIVVSEPGVTTRFSEVSDARGYDALARSLVEHHVFGYGGRPSAFRPPLYPMMLATVYAVFGESPRAARLAQSVFFLLLLPIVGALARRLAGAGAAAVAPLLAASYPIFAHYSTELLSESTAIVLVPLAILALVRLDEAPTLARAAAFGAAGAAATLVKPQLFPALALVAPVVAVGRRDRPERTRRLQALLVSVAVALGLLAPWTVRNARFLGTFAPFGTYGGYALYDGVTEYRQEDWQAHKQRVRDELGIHRADFERDNPGQTPDEVELDRRARALALDEIRRHPRRFMHTLLDHAEVLFVGVHEADVAALGQGRIPLTLILGSVPYWLALAAALSQLWRRGLGSPRAARLAFGVALLGTLASLPFNGAVRYRVAVLDPVVVALAAGGLARRRKVPH